jgi:O-antigen ligase
MAIFLAPFVYRDIPFDKISKYIVFCASAFIMLHSTAWIWYSGPTSTAGLLNYSGVFDSKHIAAATIYSSLPAAAYLFLVRKSKYGLFILTALVICILLVFQRNTMLSLLVLVFFFSFHRKSSKPLLAIIMIACLLVMIVPRSAIQHNIALKGTEIQKAEKGNIYALGAGRMGAIITGVRTWYNMGAVRLVFGLGAGGGNRITAWRGKSVHTHNQWIQTLLDYGLLGVILLIIVLSSLFKDAKRAAFLDKEGMSPIAFAFLCAMIVRTFTSNYFQVGGSELFIAFTVGYPIYYLQFSEN